MNDSELKFTVTELTQLIKLSLSELYGDVWVEGEITDFRMPSSSGHIYFALKDADSRISAVIWRSTAERMRFKLESGMHVICRGGIDVYPARGTYQLIVRRIEPIGAGALQQAFEQLKRRLKAEGLFDPARKRPIPFLPRRIAVVTSPSGAAIRDFLEVIGRRFHAVEITIVPTLVQGAGASEAVARAIQLANRVRPAFDVLVVCRGGGSAEDLWAFNEEPAVRAIAASKIPVVAGIGHETDVTLCDFAADVRALTPSEAAERIVPRLQDLRDELQDQSVRLMRSLRNRYEQSSKELALLANRPCLRMPLANLQLQRQRLDDIELRMRRGVNESLARKREAFNKLSATLNALSPLAILSRGYSMTMDEQGRVVRHVASVQRTQKLTTRLADGTIESTVDQIQRDAAQEP